MLSHHFFGFFHVSKHRLKCLVEPLNLYIPHWVAGLRGSGCNTLSYTCLANVNIWKRIFYPLIKKGQEDNIPNPGRGTRWRNSCPLSVGLCHLITHFISIIEASGVNHRINILLGRCVWTLLKSICDILQIWCVLCSAPILCRQYICLQLLI